MHYAVNIFSYETAKNEANENCVVSTRCWNGPHNKVKHEFSRRMFPGHLISPSDNIPRPVCYPYLTETFYFCVSPQVYSICQSPHRMQETKVHTVNGLGTINGA